MRIWDMFCAKPPPFTGNQWRVARCAYLLHLLTPSENQVGRRRLKPNLCIVSCSSLVVYMPPSVLVACG